MKIFQKKLSLNKEVVAYLNIDKEKRQSQKGESASIYGCTSQDVCFTECCDSGSCPRDSRPPCY